ncbi:tetratricopeptide repeat-containing sensor histidine kinase [Ancylomarina longa]|uniref:histidine kinase n=1 Tax=Ancylomarina longa TaxID=2487017 RepID=A0A434AFY4_9BACT|nr:tetratricopeptide repeat protein [Ancylomarina longa]RUT73280.1 hypothetical protein DLK05_13990 [Ancylomarina longa]
MRFSLKSILLLLLLFPESLFATSFLNDLRDQVEVTPDSAKTELFLKLSKQYRNINLDSAVYFAQKALESSKIHGNKQDIVRSNLELARNYSKSGDFFRSKQSIDNALHIATQNHDSTGIGKTLYQLGSYYSSTNQYDSSVYYFNKSIKWSEKIGDKFTKAINYNGLGIISWEKGDLERALNNYLNAYDIADELNDSNLKMTLLSNIGNIYADEKQSEKALSSYLQVLEMAKKENRIDFTATIYNNIAILYQNDKKYEKALSYFQKTLDIKRKLGDNQGIALAYNNIGENYFSQGNIDKSVNFLNQALAINRNLNLKTEIIYNLETLSQIYLKTGNYSKAHNYLIESIDLSKKLNLKGKYRDLLKQLSEYYYKSDNYKKAYTTFNQFNSLKDSLQNISRSDRIAQLQTEFETTKKEKENEILRVKNQLTQEKLNKEKTLKNYVFIFFLIALTFLVLIFILFRSKVKTNQQINKVNGMLEESNQQLEITNATKDKFFSIIAHDLKTPFNAILGFSELIKDEIISTKDLGMIEEYNNSVNEAAHSLFTLLENLLEWAKSQRGSIEFSPTQFDLYEVVQSNITLFKLKATDKSIQLDSDLEPKTMAYGDVNMVNTIVRNLINNALKFTNTNGEIHISTAIEDDFIILSVQDNGIGISKENQEKLFRLDCNYTTTGTNDETGSGLGLILCKEFAEKNGGDIWVESKLSKGSKFIITLKTA